MHLVFLIKMYYSDFYKVLIKNSRTLPEVSLGTEQFSETQPCGFIFIILLIASRRSTSEYLDSARK